MNHIRSSRRASLEPSTIDALMRIRINGPDEMEQFKAYKYAKAWIKNHLRTDDPQHRTKKKATNRIVDESVNDDLVYMPKSSIF